MPDDGVLLDIDTPEALAALARARTHEGVGMSFDPAALRAEFPILPPPGTPPLHYLDNAATARCRASVLDAVACVRNAQPRQRPARRPSARRGARPPPMRKRARRVARYLGVADADEIVFTRGTTAAINLVAHSFGDAAAARRRDRDLRARASQQHRALADAARPARPRADGPAGHRRGPARSRGARARRDAALPS